MILILGAVGLIIFYLLQGWQSTDLSKQISAGRIELQKARDEIQKLEFEVSGAFTVERIRKLATEELGMSEPKIEILTLPPLTK
jgi:cell division protein FtsL